MEALKGLPPETVLFLIGFWIVREAIGLIKANRDVQNSSRNDLPAKELVEYLAGQKSEVNLMVRTLDSIRVNIEKSTDLIVEVTTEMGHTRRDIKEVKESVYSLHKKLDAMKQGSH